MTTQEVLKSKYDLFQNQSQWIINRNTLSASDFLCESLTEHKSNWGTGPHVSIKTIFAGWYGILIIKIRRSETILFYDENSYTGKTASLYWDIPQISLWEYRIFIIVFHPPIPVIRPQDESSEVS